MDSISRVSSLLEPTRDLTIDASILTSSLRKTPTTSGTAHSSAQAIRILLNSKHEREVLDGLRRFITLTQSPKRQADPTIASQLLPTILKNISSPNTHIRKLVYLILIQHAESDQDTALLAINSIQKALSAPDPHLRALALRTISSLRVPVIAQIVALGIKKGVADMSPIVRKTAALAIPKCWKLDPSTAPQLEGYLGVLLGDRQYIVVGAACTALLETGLLETVEERETVVGMLHGVYRGLCKKLVDMDDWGQCAASRVLGVYARRCFPRRTKRVKKGASRPGPDDQQKMQAFYDEPDKSQEPSSTDESETITLQDPDLTLLLDSAQPLLQSRNPAVIVAVTRLYLALEAPSSPSTPHPPPHLAAAVPALLTLLRPTSTPSITPIALHNILQLALLYPAAFVPYTRHFLLRSTDSPSDTAPLKLETLTLLFPHAPAHTQSLILAELATATHRRTNMTPTLLRAAIAAIGRCALASPPDSVNAKRCLALLLKHVKSDASGGTRSDLADVAAAEALTHVRHLIQANPERHMSTVIRLAKDLDTTSNAKARAAIVWLVGEYAGTDMSAAVGAGETKGLGSVSADVLRILAKGFADEAEEVKLQICVLAAKVYLHYLNALQPSSDAADAAETKPHPIPLLYAYIHSLIRYDTSYTLRDVARMHRALLPPVPLSTFPAPYNSSTPSMASNIQLATLLLLAPKPPPVTPSPASERQGLALGSAALVLGESVKGYETFAFPGWVSVGEEPDARLRDVGGVGESGPSGISNMRGGAGVPGVGGSAFGGRNAGADGGNEIRVGQPVVRERNLEDWLGGDDEESEGVEGSEETETETESEEEEDEEEESSEEEEEGEGVALVGRSNG